MMHIDVMMNLYFVILINSMFNTEKFAILSRANMHDKLDEESRIELSMFLGTKYTLNQI